MTWVPGRDRAMRKLVKILLVLFVAAAPAEASLLAPGDQCRVGEGATPITMTARPKGAGKRTTLKRRSVVEIRGLVGHEYELRQGKKTGFGREELFDKGCFKVGAMDLLAPPKP